MVRMEGFNGRLGQQELVADGHAMTEAPLHFGRPVSLRRMSDAECLRMAGLAGLYFQVWLHFFWTTSVVRFATVPGSQAISTSFRSG